MKDAEETLREIIRGRHIYFGVRQRDKEQPGMLGLFTTLHLVTGYPKIHSDDEERPLSELCVASLNFAREICSDYADFLDDERGDNFEWAY